MADLVRPSPPRITDRMCDGQGAQLIATAATHHQLELPIVPAHSLRFHRETAHARCNSAAPANADEAAGTMLPADALACPPARPPAAPAFTGTDVVYGEYKTISLNDCERMEVHAPAHAPRRRLAPPSSGTSPPGSAPRPHPTFCSCACTCTPLAADKGKYVVLFFYPLDFT